MTLEELVERFGKHVDAGAATVLIGAGLSQPAGYPSWATLLAPMCTELGIEPMDDLPQLAQYYVDGVPDGRTRLDQHVSDALAVISNPALPVALRLLSELPINEYWTTNYDPLVERSIPGAHVFANDPELATAILEPTTRRVYKIHGSIDPPGPIVLTRDDYERYPTSHPRFWHLLQAQFLTKSFLFLGFGFTDPNLEIVFKLVRLSAADVKREHFTIMKQPDTDAERRLFQLKVGELGRVGVGVVVVDTYDEIAIVLGKLVARCRPPQLMVSGSAPPEVARTTTPGAYPTGALPPDVVTVAEAIGDRLARTTIAVVAGGEVGALVGYQMVRKLEPGSYTPARFTLVRRRDDRELDPPNRRLGQVVFTGENPGDLRSAALREVRALLVLAGAEGTRSEINSALAAGLGIVPVASTGGSARAHWQRMLDDFDSQVLGGRAVDRADFERLAHPDPDIAADAAVRLLTQALYLS